MRYLQSRLKEPSSYAGLAGILTGLGMIFDINEAPAVAEAAGQAAQVVAQSGDWKMGLLTVSFGALASFLR